MEDHILIESKKNAKMYQIEDDRVANEESLLEIENFNKFGAM
jgi:hypothetical protein